MTMDLVITEKHMKINQIFSFSGSDRKKKNMFLVSSHTMDCSALLAVSNNNQLPGTWNVTITYLVRTIYVLWEVINSYSRG
jgi:hypothetical protein